MSSPVERTVYAMLRHPRDWPPPVPRCILFDATTEALFELFAHPDGHIQAIARDSSGAVIFSTDFQGFSAHPGRMLAWMAAWSPTSAAVSIQYRCLKRLQDASRPIILRGKGLPRSAPQSFDHHYRNAICREWREWRARRFPQSSAPRDHRTMKTPEEEALDLRRAILSLQFLAEQVDQGKLYLLGHLATELRALIYWYRDTAERGYNPLLLRMASKADLPLPVYAFDDGGPPVFPSSQYHFRSQVPQYIREFRGQRLMDLQQWLQTSALTQHHYPHPGATRSISHAALISEAANTLGCAHYDEDRSDYAEMLSRLGGHSAAILPQYMENIAYVVSTLGGWVLTELEKRSIISRQPDLGTLPHE